MSLRLPKCLSNPESFVKILHFILNLPYSRPRKTHALAIALDIFCIILIFALAFAPASQIISPLVASDDLRPLKYGKSTKEVFGFAPHWTLDKLHNVDFNVLTTLAYFDIPILSDGNLATTGPGYQSFMSRDATAVFKKAHRHGTRVVLTITQMDPDEILVFLDSDEGQTRAIEQTVGLVEKRGIDGINIDIEYGSDAGEHYRKRFTQFARNLTNAMHQKVAGSKVTVSVYASSIKQPKIYSISDLARTVDGIFMMAYDYGYRGSDEVIPTAPLYGYKEGTYWYDISTAVEDFLWQMPADKLILGTPWYGYNYAIYGEPRVKAETRPSWSWRGAPSAQTYAVAKDIKPQAKGISHYKEGWDDLGKVSWKAYYVPEVDTWRMIFVEDSKSLALKYDFAKSKNLLGVGMWALGFDGEKTDLWDLLRHKFGNKFADTRVNKKGISDETIY